MKKIIIWLLAISFLSSCYSSRTISKASTGTTSTADSCKDKKSSSEETTIIWYQPSAANKGDSFPRSWILTPPSTHLPSNFAPQKLGYMKITKKSESSNSKMQSSIATISKQEDKTKVIEKTKTDWKSTILIAIFATILLEIVKNRYSIITFFKNHLLFRKN